jgi:hypothetical protein
MTRHDAWRRDMIARARLTSDELATAAARFGIVADRDALPLNATRPPAWDAVEAGRIEGDTRQPGNNIGAYARLAEAIDRQRATGDCWAAVQSARADKTTHTERFYESSDGFDEIMRGGPMHAARAVIGATIARHPIYALGIAVRSR